MRVAGIRHDALVASLFGGWLLFVFIGSRPYQNFLVADSSGETDFLRQLAVLGIAALAGPIFLLERRKPRITWILLGCVLAYACFLLYSATWSLNPSFVIRRAGVFLLVSVALCILADHLQRRALLLPTLLSVMLVVLVVDWVSMLVLHDLSIDHDGRWKGIHIHKNVAGGIMALAAIVFFWAGLQRRRWMLASAAAAVFLVMTASKTSLALLLVSSAIVVGVLMLRVLRLLGGLWMTAIGLLLLLVLWVTVDVGVVIDHLIALVYGDVTLTGRTLVWDYALAKHAEAPWLGYGFGSFWGMGDLTPAISEDVPAVREFSQAHNGYLDVLLQTGWIGASGLFVLVLYVVSSGVVRVTTAGPAWPTGALCLHIVVFVMLHNLLESTWLSALSVEWTLFFLAGSWLILERSE